MSLHGREVCFHAKKQNWGFCGNAAIWRHLPWNYLYAHGYVCARPWLCACVQGCVGAHIYPQGGLMDMLGTFEAKPMYFLLQIAPLFGVCWALRWFVQRMFKNNSLVFGFISWIDHDHKVWSNIPSPHREVFHWRYCLKTKGTGMSIIWLLIGCTYVRRGVTALSFSSNSIAEKINRDLNCFPRDKISLNSWNIHYSSGLSFSRKISFFNKMYVLCADCRLIIHKNM